MNKVFELGRITATPEVREAGENKVCNFRIAVDKRMGKNADHPEANFFGCTAWGKTAEIIATYFNKGDRILVSGRLENRRYEDKDGATRTVTEIIVEDFDFIEKKNTSDGSNKVGVNTNTSNSYDEDDDDDLPI